MAYAGSLLKAEGQRDGGELVSQELARHGVRYVFGLAGGHINPIWYSLERAGIKLIDVRHEVSAVNAAEGWALATGEPGVCIVTAGPGATNAVTGVANAQLAGYPIVCISGASTLHGHLTGEVQEMDQLSLFRPLCKWAERCVSVERLPEYVAMAMRAATTGRPGVAYLEVPIDVLHSIADNEALRSMAILDKEEQRLAPSPKSVEHVARLISEAEAPLLVAGSGVHWSGASQALQAFVEATGIPFVTRTAGRGAVSDEHPLSLGLNWERAAPKADVIIAVGTRFNYTFAYGQFTRAKHIIQIDIEPAELGRPGIPTSVGMVADAKLALEALATAVRPGNWSNWKAAMRGEVARIHADFIEAAKSDVKPIHQGRVIQEVMEVAGRNAIFDLDGTDNVVWGQAGLRALAPGRLLGMGPLGSIGNGSGRLLGAGCANPGAPLAWIVGDGSFGFNCMELDTAARHDIPLVAIIMNNHGFGGKYWVPLGLRHYEKMAPGFGIDGELVQDPDELRPALERAFRSGRPYILNVIVAADTDYFTGRQ